MHPSRHLAVDPVVEDVRSVSGPRLEYSDRMGPDEHTDVARRIIQIAEDSGLHRADLDAGRLQPFGYPVITPRTFVGGLCLLVEIPRTIGTGLNTVPAADAIFLIDEHDPIGRLVGGPDGTNLHARRIFALIAELWHEESLRHLFVAVSIAKAVILWRGRRGDVHGIGLRIDARLILALEIYVTLDPRAKILWIERDFVFDLAGLNAAQAADAACRIDSESPTMFGPIVCRHRPFRGKACLRRRGCGGCGGSEVPQRNRADTRANRRRRTHLTEQGNETASACGIRD